MATELYKAQNIIGLSVVATSNGSTVGTVHDVIYNADENKVESLVLSEGGWLSDAKVLKLSNVSSIGTDNIMIEHPDLVMTETQSPNKVHALIHENDTIRRKSVITESGHDMGFVTDIYFSQDGSVERLEITPNIWNEMTNNTQTIEADRIVQVGKDVTVVK